MENTRVKEHLDNCESNVRYGQLAMSVQDLIRVCVLQQNLIEELKFEIDQLNKR